MPYNYKTIFSMCLCILAFVAPGWALPINPGFEDGLTGYTASGNVQVIPNIGSVSPTEGDAFILLSTGPFDVGNDGVPDASSIISDLFTLEDDAGQLSFDFDFLTEEFTGENALAFDYFSTSLITPMGTESVSYMDTGYSGFSPIDGGIPVASPDGSLFLDHTGFLNVRYDVTAWAGMDIALMFSISDEYDGSFDSGVLIDHIDVIPQTAPVPEPATMFLLGTGLFGLATIHRKKLIR